MSTMTSQITSLTIVYSTVCSFADQRKHQSSASLAFVRGIRRWPVNSLHKGPVTRKMSPFDDVIMLCGKFCEGCKNISEGSIISPNFYCATIHLSHMVNMMSADELVLTKPIHQWLWYWFGSPGISRPQHQNGWHIEGILPKGPYLPCVSMVGRAILARYPRHIQLERVETTYTTYGTLMSLVQNGLILRRIIRRFG